MRIKYYLRGLGTGILVTTIIITISNSIRNNEMKMQQITGQTPTGMYQTQAPSSDAASGETSGSTGSTQPSETSGSSEEPDVSVQPTTRQTQEPTTESAGIPAATQPESSEITVSFNSVSSSEAASRLLQDAGLIEDWREFNTFLIDNGYDRKISSGTFTFKGTETFEEIMAIITRGR